MQDRTAELCQTVETRREALRLGPPSTPELAARSNDLGAAMTAQISGFYDRPNGPGEPSPGLRP